MSEEFCFRSGDWFCRFYTAKRIGCFKHWMVTLVADKLRSQWLWERVLELNTLAISAQIVPYNWQPEHLWGRHYTSTLKNMMLIQAGGSVVTISVRSWLLFDTTRCDPFLSGYLLQDPGCKIWSGKLPQWFSYIQLAIDNLTNVSLACLQLG